MNGYELEEPYYRGGPLPQVAGSPHREEGTLEFLRSVEELIGELCRAGFMIEDLLEPVHGNASGAGRVRSSQPLRRAVRSYQRVASSSSTVASPHGESAALWTPS